MLGSGEHLRIGELLIDVGILNQEKVLKAVAIAQKRSLPVGRALVMCGILSEHLLQAALQAQSLYRDGLISHEECINAIAKVWEHGVTFEEALSLLRWVRDKKVITNRLGELLVEAGILTATELTSFLSRSKESGLPLGRFLASIGVVPESLIVIALNMQMLIRDRKIERGSAIGILKSATERQFELKPSQNVQLPDDFPASISIRLGQLLINASVIKSSDMMTALEAAVLENKQLGEVLVAKKVISQEQLEGALILQAMVASGSLKPTAAARSMGLYCSSELSLHEAIAQSTTIEMKLGDTITLEVFLGLAGVINTADIAKLGSSHPALLGKKLVDTGRVSAFFFRDCQRIHTFLLEGMITLERAILIVRHCQSTGKSAKISLAELGWKLSA